MPAHANLQSKAVKPPSLAAAATASSLDATAPEPTKLSARRRDLQKKTQRRTGVRMRYRGTVVQRNRKGRGMGDTPSWRPDTDAHCYSRALLVTLFFAAFRSGNAGATPGLRYQPRCFHLQRLIRLAASHASGPPIQHTGSPGPNTRQNGICNRKFRAAPSRRAHGISLKIKFNDHRMQQALGESLPGHLNNDAHCFSRALLVALFCPAFVFRRGLRICCSNASATEVNLIGGICQGFGVKCAW